MDMEVYSGVINAMVCNNENLPKCEKDPRLGVLDRTPIYRDLTVHSLQTEGTTWVLATYSGDKEDTTRSNFEC